MLKNIKNVFKGSVFQTKDYGKLDYLENVLILTNEKGIIEKVVKIENKEYDKIVIEASQKNILVELSENQYFLPGFVDLHIHAPQWPQAGIALDAPLDVWLNECTFPLEAKYSDIDFAREVYNDLVKSLIARGTTTAMYFATVHHDSSLELVKACINNGQRGLVGKVVMDNVEMTPDYYRDESTEKALRDTEKFINSVTKLGEGVIQGVYPVVTPRFIPSCTDEVLSGLGEIVKKYDAYVQSHCSECDWEHNYVKSRLGISDTEALNKFGLLGEKSIMAHCNFLSEKDGQIFREKGTSIAHCPISNAYFANAVLPVKRLNEQGVNIGLGTDISGGFSPSLYDNIKQTVMSSRMLEDGVNSKLSSEDRGVNNSRVSVIEAFYLATKGGGDALKLPLGIIEEGYICDLQVIDIATKNNKLPNFNVFNNKEHLLEKILYLSNINNIKQVWIQGKLVFENN